MSSTGARRTLLGAVGTAALVAGLGTVGVTADDDREDRDGRDGRGRGERARNVVLLVGDGLSMAARDATRLFSVGQDGRLAMDSLRYAGWTSTDPADPKQAVTDSAAAATAFATGVHTFNGASAWTRRASRCGRCSRTRAARARRPGS